MRTALVIAATCAAAVLGLACGRVGFAELPDAGALPGDGQQCPSSFMTVSGHCYRYSATTADWPTAEQQCEADAGAHLAVVDDSEEADVIVSLQIDEAMWIGASDRIVEGDYRTVTGQPMFLSWGAGFPTTLPDCVEISGTGGLLKTLDCTSANQLLCEWDGRLVVPANF